MEIYTIYLNNNNLFFEYVMNYYDIKFLYFYYEFNFIKKTMKHLNPINNNVNTNIEILTEKHTTYRWNIRCVTVIFTLNYFILYHLKG